MSGGTTIGEILSLSLTDLVRANKFATQSSCPTCHQRLLEYRSAVDLAFALKSFIPESLARARGMTLSVAVALCRQMSADGIAEPAEGGNRYRLIAVENPFTQRKEQKL